MKKLILFLILGITVLSLVKCGFSMYSGLKNIPEYAKREVLSKKYEKLITDVDKQIMKSNTALSMGANLESIDYPENTFYVAIEREEGDDIRIKGKTIKGSHSIFITNGFGYGKIGSQKIVIITRPINNYDLEDVEIYLRHKN